MEGEETSDKATPSNGVAGSDYKQGKARLWAIRHGYPAHERYTAYAHEGKSYIFFKFPLPEGQDKLEDAVYEIMHKHKKTPDGHHTGLKCIKSGAAGEGYALWQIQDDSFGRTTADRLGEDIRMLARKSKRDEGIRR